MRTDQELLEDGERRGKLTKGDIQLLLEAIDGAYEKTLVKRFEDIGFDISTPKSRAEIRLDTGFTRDLRKGTGRVKMAMVGAIAVAILAVVGHWLVAGIISSIQSVIAVKSP